MKRSWRVLVFLNCFFSLEAGAQDGSLPPSMSALLEAQAEKKDVQPEDDSYQLDLEQFARHPLNMNSVTEDDLAEFHFLTPLQIRNFVSYRKLLGPLLSIHELQAVPGWDIETIRKLLPYTSVNDNESIYSSFRERSKNGDAAFLLRAAQVIEKSKGYMKPITPGDAYYEGSPQNLFFRYTYSYKQLLAYGMTGEKDAGEPFFRGAQRYGFDFYSFHFFLQKAGLVKALAIGDFTVNLGQGLIQWQTTSFTKSTQSLTIKREAPCLRPYHSAGEFNFHRGAGISLEKEKWQTTLFVSLQKISTNPGVDTSGREDLFTSFQNSGYHRTPAEIADRNNSSQFSIGGNFRYTCDQGMLGFNMIHFHFSRPFQKRDEPYNFFSLKGTGLTDYSLDYHYTFRNIHLFGEFAMDQWLHRAVIQGALISLSENLDMSFLYRNISPAFQSLYSDAFTENSAPNNEKGFYTGLAYKPFAGMQINMYYDLFVFSWLQYLVDGPGGGRDILIQAGYQPDKYWHIVTLYKNEIKTTDGVVSNAGTYELINPIKETWRIETEYAVSRRLGFVSRIEMISIKQASDPGRHGFLGMSGLSFKESKLSVNIGATWFETDDYNTRIYIYQPDILYNYSLPAYNGKGMHYYINLHEDLTRVFSQTRNHFRLSAWLNWGQAFYPGYLSVGSGLDEIAGNRKSELKAEVLIQW